MYRILPFLPEAYACATTLSFLVDRNKDRRTNDGGDQPVLNVSHGKRVSRAVLLASASAMVLSFGSAAHAQSTINGYNFGSQSKTVNNLTVNAFGNVTGFATGNSLTSATPTTDGVTVTGSAAVNSLNHGNVTNATVQSTNTTGTTLNLTGGTTSNLNNSTVANANIT